MKMNQRTIFYEIFCVRLKRIVTGVFPANPSNHFVSDLINVLSAMVPINYKFHLGQFLSAFQFDQE